MVLFRITQNFTPISQLLPHGFTPLVTLETVAELIVFRKYFFIAYIARSSHYFGKLNELAVFENKTSWSIKEETL